jgi:hypothetical protein
MRSGPHALECTVATLARHTESIRPSQYGRQSYVGRTMRGAITKDMIQAERQVALCERNLDNQRQMFAELKGGGLTRDGSRLYDTRI